MLKTCTAFLLLFSSTLLFAADQDNKIVAIINDEVVTKYEIDQEVDPALERVRSEYPADVFEAKRREQWRIRLMQVIENKLLLQEARRQEIVVPAKEAERRFEALLKRYGGSITELQANLRKQGISLRRQRQEMQEKMMIDLLLRRQIEPEIYISPAHIQEFYEKHKDKYQKKQRVKVQNILIATEDRPTEEARALADEVHAKIKAGLTFEKAVEMYSEGQYKAQKGVVDFFEQGTYFDAFEKGCFALKKVGQLSAPIKSPIGFHIVKLLGREGGEVTPVGEAAASIRRRIHQLQYAAKVEAYIKELRSKAYIKTSFGEGR